MDIFDLMLDYNNYDNDNTDNLKYEKILKNYIYENPDSLYYEDKKDGTVFCFAAEQLGPSLINLLYKIYLELLSKGNFKNKIPPYMFKNTITGDTPLHRAVDEGEYETVQILIEDLKLNVNEKNKLGKTPLFFCVESEEYIDILKFLLLHNAKINELDNLNKNAIFYAIKNNNKKAVEILYKKGSKLMVKKGRFSADSTSKIIKSNEINNILRKIDKVNSKKKLRNSYLKPFVIEYNKLCEVLIEPKNKKLLIDLAKKFKIKDNEYVDGIKSEKSYDSLCKEISKKLVSLHIIETVKKHTTF